MAAHEARLGARAKSRVDGTHRWKASWALKVVILMGRLWKGFWQPQATSMLFGAASGSYRGCQRAHRFGERHWPNKPAQVTSGKAGYPQGEMMMSKLVVRRQIAPSPEVGDPLVGIRRFCERRCIVLRTSVRNEDATAEVEARRCKLERSRVE